MKITNQFIQIEGFKASGIYSGIKKDPNKKDLMVLYSELPAVSGNVFTQNVACAAPVHLSKSNAESHYTQAIVVNSGNANACTGTQGDHNAQLTSSHLAELLNISSKEVIVASTGIIGVQLPITTLIESLPKAVASLSSDGFENASEAILTTDTFEKKTSVTFNLNGQDITISGMSKGSGMIHPNMATMLGFFISNINITKELLQKAVSESVSNSFNMISVDGDTSTNDMVSVLANGSAGNQLIDTEGLAYNQFKDALSLLMIESAKLIAKDGEGATKLLEVNLVGASSEDVAKKCSKAVISSSLVKAAFFGNDANWGRIVCAMGYSGSQFNVDKVDVAFESQGGLLKVFEQGAGLTFDEELALQVLKQDMVKININMNDGECNAQAWGCDLTYEYVKINGEYRS